MLDYCSEIRCGFKINAARKKLWDIELDILDHVDFLCSKHNLNYFLIGGAAIGAVRHKGFIPWDDDLDIGMLRPDYEKLVKILKIESIPNCMIQYGISGMFENGTFLRIRNTMSTAYIKNQLNRSDCVHGVFIEIYPFDKVVDNRYVRRLQQGISSILKRELDRRIDGIQICGFKGKLVLLLRPLPISLLWRAWDWTCQLFNKFKLEYVDTPALPLYMSTGIHHYRVTDLKESVKVKYEDRMVRVAIGNHNCLETHFGDYMKLPPIEERGQHHCNTVFFDPSTSYKMYLKSDIPQRYFKGEYHLSPLYGEVNNE